MKITNKTVGWLILIAFNLIWVYVEVKYDSSEELSTSLLVLAAASFLTSIITSIIVVIDLLMGDIEFEFDLFKIPREKIRNYNLEKARKARERDRIQLLIDENLSKMADTDLTEDKLDSINKELDMLHKRLDNL